MVACSVGGRVWVFLLVRVVLHCELPVCAAEVIVCCAVSVGQKGIACACRGGLLGLTPARSVEAAGGGGRGLLPVTCSSWPLSHGEASRRTLDACAGNDTPRIS